MGQLLSPSGAAGRLVTLIGPGGVGKTRLALAVALELVDAFADDVWFVDLSPLRDYRLVAASVARALDVRESGGRSAHELLIDALRERLVLLVLDNFEHVVDAAPLVADLLSRCPRLSVLVTSRTPLRLRAERRFMVEPLSVPRADRALRRYQPYYASTADWAWTRCSVTRCCCDGRTRCNLQHLYRHHLTSAEVADA